MSQRALEHYTAQLNLINAGHPSVPPSGSSSQASSRATTPKPIEVHKKPKHNYKPWIYGGVGTAAALGALGWYLMRDTEQPEPELYKPPPKVRKIRYDDNEPFNIVAHTPRPKTKTGAKYSRPTPRPNATKISKK